MELCGGTHVERTAQVPDSCPPCYPLVQVELRVLWQCPPCFPPLQDSNLNTPALKILCRLPYHLWEVYSTRCVTLRKGMQPVSEAASASDMHKTKDISGTCCCRIL